MRARNHMDSLAGLALAVGASIAYAAENKPNILFIVTDDQDFATIGAYGGNDAIVLEPDRPTLPQVLRAGGYRTGFVGKWHLGPHHNASIGMQKIPKGRKLGEPEVDAQLRKNLRGGGRSGCGSLRLAQLDRAACHAAEQRRSSSRAVYGTGEVSCDTVASHRTRNDGMTDNWNVDLQRSGNRLSTESFTDRIIRAGVY